MPRFIVRMYRDIKEQLQWRTGVILAEDDFEAEAVIKSDEDAKKISIIVWGGRKRDYFASIRKTFRDIHTSFEQLDVTELVPLPDYPEITVEYEEPTGHEQMGEDEIRVGKLKKKYRVSELLDGIEKEEERMTSKEGINIHIDNRQKFVNKPKQIVNTNQSSEQQVNIEFNISTDFPQLQEQFDELRNHLTTETDVQERELKEITENLDSLTPNVIEEEEYKMFSPLNKLSRFFKVVGREGSPWYKIVNDTKKGLAAAGKLAKTYNKFAQHLGLPLAPKFLVDMIAGE